MADVTVSRLRDGVGAGGARYSHVVVGGVARVGQVGAVLGDGVPAVAAFHHAADTEPGRALARGDAVSHAGKLEKKGRQLLAFWQEK